jgi:endonuclease YncB( thermonuclease family)
LGLFIATPARVIDGDTFDVRIDLSPFLVGGIHARIRIRGIQAPELRGPNKNAALRAKQWLAERLLCEPQIMLMVWKADSLSRYIADVMVREANVGLEMLDCGLAVPYKP